MSAAMREQKQEYTNPMGYAEVDADGFRPMGNRMLLQWQEAKDEIKAGKITLVRPETHKKAHYTGVVLQVGDMVDPDIQVGHRVLFEQFSGFEKWFDPKYGRLALIRDTDAMAVIPARSKISSMDGDYDYDN
jgi:co-chaperonin GroES (HSP10)